MVVCGLVRMVRNTKLHLSALRFTTADMDHFNHASQKTMEVMNEFKIAAKKRGFDSSNFYFKML